MATVEKIKQELEFKINKALTIIGIKAHQECVDLMTRENIVDTGTLRASIEYKIIPDEKAFILGTNIEYASDVELGTSKSKPRSYLIPTLINNKDEFEQIFEKTLKEN